MTRQKLQNLVHTSRSASSGCETLVTEEINCYVVWDAEGDDVYHSSVFPFGETKDQSFNDAKDYATL